jgi:hypothetical protein
MCSWQLDTGGVEEVVVIPLSDNIRKARKEYICEECNIPINIRDTYSHEVYIVEGEIMQHRMCMVCRNIRDVLFCSWCYGLLMDDLRTEIVDGIDGIPEDLIAKLTPEARAKVCDMIEEYTEEEE